LLTIATTIAITKTTKQNRWNETMTIIATNKDFKVEFNGSATYFVTDNNGDCWKTYKSEKAAINYMNKVA